MMRSAFPGSRFMIAALVFLFGLTWTSPAYAYIDPGTSSLILQAVLGGLAAVGAAIVLYWRKIKTLLGEKPPSPTKPAGGDISASGDKTE